MIWGKAAGRRGSGISVVGLSVARPSVEGNLISSRMRGGDQIRYEGVLGCVGRRYGVEKVRWWSGAGYKSTFQPSSYRAQGLVPPAGVVEKKD